LYRNDKLGYGSPNTGFFFYFKQGNLQNFDFNLAQQISNQVVDIGDIEGINATAMKAFVNARANICLSNLGFDSIFDETGDTISEWFYLGISSSTIHDFFAKVGNQYNRKWNEKGFTW
jgi:ribonucleotide reductase beta subunit family protein with ferritin-like domain